MIGALLTLFIVVMSCLIVYATAEVCADIFKEDINKKVHSFMDIPFLVWIYIKMIHLIFTKLTKNPTHPKDDVTRSKDGYKYPTLFTAEERYDLNKNSIMESNRLYQKTLGKDYVSENDGLEELIVVEYSDEKDHNSSQN